MPVPLLSIFENRRTGTGNSGDVGFETKSSSNFELKFTIDLRQATHNKKKCLSSRVFLIKCLSTDFGLSTIVKLIWTGGGVGQCFFPVKLKSTRESLFWHIFEVFCHGQKSVEKNRFTRTFFAFLHGLKILFQGWKMELSFHRYFNAQRLKF